MEKKSLIFVLSFVYVIFLSTIVYSQAADGQYCSEDSACDSGRCMALDNSLFNGRSNPFGIGAICVSNENWFGTCDPDYQCSDDGRRCESPDGTTTQECINQPGRRSYCGVLGGSSTCLYKKDIGASCSNNYECDSNRCRDGSCATKFSGGGGITNTNVGSAYLTAMFDTTSCGSDVDCSPNVACSQITNEFIYSPLTLADDVGGLCVTRENWVGSCGSGSTCNGDLSGCLSEDVSITCSSSFTYCRSFSDHAVCAFKKVGGLSCSQNNECISGECVNNLCTGEGIDSASPLQRLGLPSFSTVSSANCPSEKTIFKISSLNNAHAALWDDNAYQYSVCYNGTTVPANPHRCMDSESSLNLVGDALGVEVSSQDVQAFEAAFGEDFSINNFLGLSSMTNAHAEARLLDDSDAIVDNYRNNVCYGGLFCIATSGSCVSGTACMAKLSSLTNAHVASCSNTDYPISLCCVDIGGLTSDIIDSAIPETCVNDDDCTADDAECSTEGVCIIPPDTGEVTDGGVPGGEIPGTGVACTTTSQCGENEACSLDAGSGGYCDVCDPESTADIDDDGIPDCSGDDPCVGSSDPGCFDDDLGLSCSDLDGIVCGANEVCSSTSETSNQATELNCCVAETGNPGCEGASIFFAEAGVNVKFNKQCDASGRTQVQIIVEDDAGNVLDTREETTRAKLDLLGVDTSRGNPYIDTTDYSCSNINLGASTTGSDVPGYGLISVLLSLFIILAFYANRKILKF